VAFCYSCMFVCLRCDDIWRWCLWEMIGVRWSHKNGALMNEITVLKQVTGKLVSLSALCHVRTWEELQPTTQKRTWPELNQTGTWSQIPSIQSYEKETSVVYKPPSL
jgi:hypothetical protein